MQTANTPMYVRSRRGERGERRGERRARCSVERGTGGKEEST